MIKAKEAQAQSIENKAKNAIKDVEANIKKAILKGKCETNFLCSYDLIDPISDLLKENGYTVTPIQGGVKIYWG